MKVLPYIANFFLPGSAFFFIREWKIAVVWMMVLLAAVFLAPALWFLLYIGSFAHFYLATSNPGHPPLQPAHHWVRQKWGWLAGASFLVAMSLAGTKGSQEVAGVRTATEPSSLSQPAPETPAVIDPVDGSVQPEVVAAEEPPATAEASETTEAKAPAEAEVSTETTATAYADELLILGNNPESVPSETYSTEEDRQYYSWARPDLGEGVSSVWRSPEDWWIEIQNPAFAASDLGELEPVDEQLSRVTSGPLAGLLVIDSSPVNIHIKTQTFHETEEALLQQLDAQETPTVVQEAPVVEEQPLPMVEQMPAEEPNLYFSNCKEAKAAGYSNMTPDHPGYRDGLDRDDDGLACES